MRKKIGAARTRRIIFPEQNDPRIIAAARTLLQGELAQAVFLHEPASPIEGLLVFDRNLDKEMWFAKAVNLHIERQALKGISRESAQDEVRACDLLLAALLVSVGYADSGVAGSVASSAAVLRAGIRGVGLDKTANLLSSCFLMQFPDRIITFGDCTIVPDPSATELAQIAIACANTHRSFTNEEPKVALLSFSSKGSSTHPRTDKVRQALALARELAPNLNIDGELQFDAALFPDIGKQKAPESLVAGQASVLIFPDLDAGNIGYKIAERLGGAQALGPVSQGMEKPWMDLSRACSTEDIVGLSIIACSQVKNSETSGGQAL